MPEVSQLIKDAEDCVAEGQWQAASRAYEALAAIYPCEPEVHYLHGRVLMEISQWQAALGRFDRALTLSSTEPRYHLSRGDSFQAMGALHQASQAYHDALKLDPHYSDAMIHLGNTLHRLGDLPAALKWFQKAHAIKPAGITSMNNIGKTYQDMGDVRQAISWYDKALAIAPQYAEARFNRAVALLTTGDYLNGWREYEWRFQRKSAHRVYPHQLAGKRWNGRPFPGKRLLVHCEQGMGDVIQFCRFLPDVKALGGKLILEVHKPLASLLQGLGSVDRVVIFDPVQPPVADYDYHIPLMSLPYLLGTTVENLADKIPYLRPVINEDFRSAGDASGRQRPSVGIVWSGSITDPRRSCPFDVIEKLGTAFESIRFVSLQKELPHDVGMNRLRQCGIAHWGDRLKNFNDTAVAISQLDLLISIDTAAAHLSGAMGMPVWILLPFAADWRWLEHRNDSPWYPTARLFRQTAPNDWNAIISIVIEALGKHFPVSPVSCTTTIPSPIFTDHRQVGDRLAEQGDLNGAIEAYGLALDQHPACAETHFQLANALHRLNRLEEAISAYERAVEINPALYAAHRNLGLAAHQTGRIIDAIGHYEAAVELKPGAVDLLNTLGALHAQTESLKKAEVYYKRALQVEPDSLSAHYNLGNLHLRRGLLAPAAEQYRFVLERDPDHLSTLCNMGRTCHRMGCFQEALHYYERGLAIDPCQPELRFNRAITLLLNGKWREAWSDYEWRFRCHNRNRIYPHALSGKRWNGESFEGKTLLVHAEQGLGDAIQFVRYIPKVKELGGKVILETHPSLIRLFGCVEGVDHLVELSLQRGPQVHYDLYVPLCSLCGIFDTTPEQNAPDGAYLSVDPSEIEKWRCRLPSSGINIGIVWAGSDTYPERTCSLRDFALLFDLSGINWIALQKGPAAVQPDLELLPSGVNICNWGETFSDFRETAAAVSSLDLVISIDTSVAHLAGALGKQVWLLLPYVPDWRWLLNITTSPWYGRMQLIRQIRQGDWTAVMNCLRKKLADLTTANNRLAANLHLA